MEKTITGTFSRCPEDNNTKKSGFHVNFQDEAISEQERLEESRMLIDDLGLKAAEKGSLDRCGNFCYYGLQFSSYFQWGLFG